MKYLLVNIRLSFNSIILMALFSPCMSGCQPVGEGENWSIGSNNISDTNLALVYICDPKLPKACWFKQSLSKRARPDRRHLPSYGGHTYLSDSGEKIPEFALVSWIGPVELIEGQIFDAEAIADSVFEHGPYLVPIRSRIPAAVLSKAKRDGYLIEIGISVGIVPLQVNWRMVYSGPNFVGPRTVLLSGGDMVGFIEKN